MVVCSFFSPKIQIFVDIFIELLIWYVCMLVCLSVNLPRIGHCVNFIIQSIPSNMVEFEKKSNRCHARVNIQSAGTTAIKQKLWFFIPLFPVLLQTTWASEKVKESESYTTFRENGVFHWNMTKVLKLVVDSLWISKRHRSFVSGGTRNVVTNSIFISTDHNLCPFHKWLLERLALMNVNAHSLSLSLPLYIMISL